MTKEDALSAARIASAHHQEIAELAVAESSDGTTDTLLDAGDSLDVAVVMAHSEGASLFELWKATKLPVGYLAALTNGAFES